MVITTAIVLSPLLYICIKRYAVIVGGQPYINLS